MDYQLIFAVLMGVLASWYVLRRLRNQTTRIEQDPKCMDCVGNIENSN